MPHVPLYVSPEFEGSSNAGLYGDVIEELDWSTGELIKTLKELNLLNNTLIIFASDNGPWLTMGDHGGSAGELRSGKGALFEGGVRVPAIFHWPDGIEPKGGVDTTISMLDIFPTLSSLAGAAIPADRHIDGVDISGLLEGKKIGVDREFHFPAFSGTESAGIRVGEWKLLLPRKGYPRFLEPILKLGMHSHGLQLFNLELVPLEEQDVSSDFPEIVESLTRQLAHYNQSIANDNDRVLIMKASGADHKGYTPLAVKVIFLGLAVLILLFFVARWLAKKARYLMSRKTM